MTMLNKREFDGNNSVFAFLTVIFTLIVFSVFVSVLRENSGLEIDDFWVSAVLQFIQYVLLFAVFVWAGRRYGFGFGALFREVGLVKPQDTVYYASSNNKIQRGVAASESTDTDTNNTAGTNKAVNETRTKSNETGIKNSAQDACTGNITRTPYGSRTENNFPAELIIKNLIITVLLSLLCIAGFILVTSAVSWIFNELGYPGSGADFAINSFGVYITAVLVTAVLPAFIEELLFRGVILRGFQKSFGAGKAVVASAVLFSLFHLSPAQTVFQFVLGIVLALVVIKTGRLVYAMVLHFVNNFSVLSYTYISGQSEMLVSWNVLTVSLTVALAAVCLFLILHLLKRLKHHGAESLKAAAAPCKTVSYGSSTSLSASGGKTQTAETGTKRFFSFDNFGYFICVLLAGAIWCLNFMG